MLVILLIKHNQRPRIQDAFAGRPGSTPNAHPAIVNGYMALDQSGGPNPLKSDAMRGASDGTD